MVQQRNSGGLTLGSLRDLYRIVFRHLGKMTIVMLAALATCAAIVFYGSPVYNSDARVFVQIGRESIALDPTVSTGQVVGISQSRSQEIQSEIEILTSRDLFEQVVDDLGPELIGPKLSRDNAVEKLSRQLVAEAATDSNIISVQLSNSDASNAQTVLNALLAQFLEKHIAVHRTRGAYEFFSRESGTLSTRIAKLEDDLAKFKADNGVSSVVEQRLALLARVAAHEQSFAEAESGLVTAKARLASLAAAELDDPAVEDVRSKLNEYRLEELDLLTRYRSESRPIETVRAKISSTERLLSKVRDERRSASLAVEEAGVAALQAKQAAVERQLAEARSELASFNSKELTVARLEADLVIQRAHYAKYLESSEQARIDDALEDERISNISIVQPASLPVRPVHPQPVLYFAIAILLGLFGAFGLAFLMEYLDDSVRTPEQVESRLGLPTLASLPRISSLGVESATRIVKGGRPSAKKRDLQHGLEDIAGQLLSSMDQTFAVTGGRSGDGASTVAAHLAATVAAHAHGPVLLVDGDVEGAALTRAQQLEGQAGLVDMLTGAELAVEPTASVVPNLLVLPSGTTRQASLDVDAIQRARQLVRIWKQKYAFIIFDLPELSGRSSLSQIASLCDNVILVVDAERTRWQVAERSKTSLASVHARIAGVVLNKRAFPIPNWLYRTL